MRIDYMRFYTGLFLTVVLLISKSYAVYFENADALVAETAQKLGSHLSPLVLPQNAKRAENLAQTSRVIGGNQHPREEFLSLPHPHLLTSMDFLNRPLFSDCFTAVLAQQFFPNMESELVPNTVAINDPIGKLNLTNQKNDREKENAARRLGGLARVIQDAFKISASTEDLVQTLLQEWGVANPSQTKVFKEIDIEEFAKQESMEALLKLRALVIKSITAHEQGEGDNLPQEGEEDQETVAFRRTVEDPHPLTAMVRLFFPTLMHPCLLHEEDLEKFSSKGGMKFSDKNLMLLRKRHVSWLIARQVHAEIEEGRSDADSYALAQIMSFFWATSNGKFLSPFYEGFFQQPLKWKVDALEATTSSKIVAAQLKSIKKDPHAFWELPPHQQTHLLHLDLSLRTFRLPTGSMAQPFPQQGSYSDCVESAIRGVIWHLLRNPGSGEIEVDLLPEETPFKDYFSRFSDEKNRFSIEGRNSWAAETWKILGAKRVNDKFGLIPSLENVFLIFQLMMRDQEPVVQPITSETTAFEISDRYRKFLSRLSAWYSEKLARPIELAFDEDGVRLGREENRTTGTINLRVQPKQKAPLHLVGYMLIEKHHGEYVKIEDSACGEDSRPLVECLMASASTEEALERLLPWITPSLINASSSSEGESAVGKIMRQIGRYFSWFDYLTSPDLYVSALRGAIVQGTPKDQNCVLKAARLLDSGHQQNEGTLMLCDLLEVSETAPKVSSSILREIAVRSPRLLEIQGESNPRDNFRMSLNLLELLLERGEMDAIKQAAPSVSQLRVGFSDKMKRRSKSFWLNLSSIKDAFPHLKSLTFRSEAIASWSEEDKRELQMHLPIYGGFSVNKVAFSTLTSELLEFFWPVISADVQNIEYIFSSTDFHASDEKIIADNKALHAKFSELQKRGSLPASAHLRTRGELATLARDH